MQKYVKIFCFYYLYLYVNGLLGKLTNLLHGLLGCVQTFVEKAYKMFTTNDSFWIAKRNLLTVVGKGKNNSWKLCFSSVWRYAFNTSANADKNRSASSLRRHSGGSRRRMFVDAQPVKMW